VVREYPLVLVLAALARPWGPGRAHRWEWALVLGAIPFVLAPPALMLWLRYNPGAPFGMAQIEQATRFILLPAAIFGFLVRDRALLFVGVLAMITLSAHHVAGRYDWQYSERSFFGVMRVAGYHDERMGGEVRMLMHGTTLHGAQATDPVFACQP